MLTKQQSPLVLVVDDDVFMRGMLQNLFKGENYRVIVATEGIKALEEFQRSSPDLVLMDAAMPIMDGFTACAKLKQLKAGANVPVIMITSLDDEQSVDKAFEAGAVEFITKPIQWAVLRHRVKVILQARQAENALRQSENRFRGIFEQAAMGIALVNMEGQLVQCNSALQEMLGFDETSLRGKLFNKFFYPYDTTVEKTFHQQLLDSSSNYYQMEKYFFRLNSPMLWARLTTSLVKDADGLPQFFIQMVEDITERKRAEASLRLAEKVFEMTSDGVVITNAEGNILDVNQSFLRSTGYIYQEVLNQNPRFLQSGQHDKTFFAQMWQTAQETGHWQGKISNRCKNGEIYSVWMSLSAVRGEHNEVTHYVAVYSNFNALDQDKQRIYQLTHYDVLTELPNKLLFKEYLTRACHQSERLALLYVDLDDFKQINDRFGFKVGDQVLKVIAQRLKQCVREGDCVARLESDEFGIIMSPIHQDYDAQAMAEKICARIAEPISLSEQTPQVDCNIGICFYPNEKMLVENNNSDLIIQYADIAMYFSKETGKNAYHIYTELPIS
jgi:diguanylate cyclase (GGDEF)-like protein/PAS domain S-box-containing protein